MKVGLAVVAAIVLLTVAATGTSAGPSTNTCTIVQTRDLIRRFATAFNRGDAATLNRVWSKKPNFKWYSVSTEPGQRVQSEAYRRDTLSSYFAKCHTAHERLTLTSITVNSTSNGYRNFQYRLLRSADDLTAGPVDYEGKGVLTCRTGQLGVWSMGAAGS